MLEYLDPILNWWWFSSETIHNPLIIWNFIQTFDYTQVYRIDWLIFCFFALFPCSLGRWKKKTDGKYLVLPSGELHIRDVGPEDGYKSYQCRTKHRLTGEARLSATKGRLVITGMLFFVSKIYFLFFPNIFKIISIGNHLIIDDHWKYIHN